MKRKFLGRIPFILSLLLCMAAGFENIQAQDEILTIDASWQEMEEMHSLVRALAADDVTESMSLHQWADRWLDVDQVVLQDRTVVAVDHSYLVALLRAQPVDLAHLNALLERLLTADHTTVPEAFDARHADALANILARPEFQWEPSPWQQLLAQVRQRIREFLRRLFPEREGSGTLTVSLPGLPTFLMIVGSMILFFVLFSVFQDLSGVFVSEAELAAHAKLDDADLTSSTALKKAHTLSAGGDYRSAVRYLYLSTLLLLDERDILRYDRTLTNREYVRKLRRAPRLARTFQNVVNVFDRVWYGNQKLDASDFEAYAAKVDDLKREP
jgi:hypothetical protein